MLSKRTNRRARRATQKRRTSRERRKSARPDDKIDMEYSFIGTSLLKIVCLLGFVLGLMNYAVYAERRVSAFMPNRVRAHRRGFSAFPSSHCHAATFFLSEQLTPAHPCKLRHLL